MNKDEVVIGEVATMTYTNYRGERADRLVLPQRVWFGATDWHPQPQWLMDAYDFDREALRSFAIGDVEGFERVDTDVLDGPRAPAPTA